MSKKTKKKVNWKARALKAEARVKWLSANYETIRRREEAAELIELKALHRCITRRKGIIKLRRRLKLC
jgi:hypothetical protein